MANVEEIIDGTESKLKLSENSKAADDTKQNAPVTGPALPPGLAAVSGKSTADILALTPGQGCETVFITAQVP